MNLLIFIIVFLLATFKRSNNNKYQKVSVIVPAFNEENTVAKVVNVIQEVSYVDEIVVVNDGSTDKTAEEASKAGAKVINHEKNLGKGAAIKTGFENIETDIIAFIDADIFNLTPTKVDKIIRPILDGKTEITKTKFFRESGRVTELTAKPLLKFFFPEISFEQPLSGQFAAKKDVLEKIQFEDDYGVDVGIVLDADIQGISIKEVDIGEIQHDLSPLKDLNLMANEVVRTIISRATDYGRITIIDSIGNYIRMAALGLSLIILGMFTIFFVQPIPLEAGIIITFIGIITSIYYIIKLIIKSINTYKKTPTPNTIKSFFKIHSPVIILALVLILMISTFLGAATFEQGSISIEPNSRHLVIFQNQEKGAIDVRGPYKVDSALENEVNILRVPENALNSLGLNYNDTIIINKVKYNINETRPGEDNILRLPQDVRNVLKLETGEIIQDSRIYQKFEDSLVNHNTSFENQTFIENFIISSRKTNVSQFEVIIDNESNGKFLGVFSENKTYNLLINNEIIENIVLDKNSFNNTYKFYYNGHVIEIIFKNTNYSSIKHFISSDKGNFFEIKF